MTNAAHAEFAAARAICRRHARTFYFASHILPREKRDRAYAVYGFCRMIDDAVDADDDALAAGSSLEARLGAFTNALDRIYAGDVELPGLVGREEAKLALRAFGRVARECEIPKRYFLELAEGCSMDLTITRYQSWQQLERYCYLVAGVVGLIMAKVFGVHAEPAAEHAVAMGNAMQLTNILRDVKEDFARGRIYLPADELARFGTGEADIAAGKLTPAFREMLKFQIARTRQLYAQGFAGLKYIPNDGSRLCAAAMAVNYGGILGAIEKQQLDVFARRARLTGLQKTVNLPAAWNLARSAKSL
jgi:phytoene synthase